MKPILTAFKTFPDRGRSLARDLRVPWTLEEVGQPHDVRPVSLEALKEHARPVFSALQGDGNRFIKTMPAFNGPFKAECLNAHWFLTLAETAEKVED